MGLRGIDSGLMGLMGLRGLRGLIWEISDFNTW